MLFAQKNVFYTKRGAILRETFVIGDVHGMYDSLVALLAKLPKESDIIFVGDLIDRGAKSADVIELIRQKGYRSVLGNHEDTFIRFFRDYFRGMDSEELIDKWKTWLFKNGGSQTLESYGFTLERSPSKAILEQIKSDLEWLERLPIYIELGSLSSKNIPIVVSHSNITKVWHYRDIPILHKKFRETALRTRDLEYDKSSEIFNIYGHTPTINRKGDFWVNVDSGCCYTHAELGVLSAYSLRDKCIISQKRLEEKG